MQRGVLVRLVGTTRRLCSSSTELKQCYAQFSDLNEDLVVYRDDKTSSRLPGGILVLNTLFGVANLPLAMQYPDLAPMTLPQSSLLIGASIASLYALQVLSQHLVAEIRLLHGHNRRVRILTRNALGSPSFPGIETHVDSVGLMGPVDTEHPPASIKLSILSEAARVTLVNYKANIVHPDAAFYVFKQRLL